MKGDIVFHIYGMHAGRTEDVFFGAFRTEAAAEGRRDELRKRVMNGGNWAARYHDRGFEIRPLKVATDFEIPARPKPRDAFWIETAAQNAPGEWSSMEVTVFRRGDPSGGAVASYQRNHTFFSTFEPFRQGERCFALISRDYTTTAVMDLESGVEWLRLSGRC